MKKIPLLLAVLFALGFASVAAAAEPVPLRAILIRASPEKKDSDPRLREHVEILRRLVPGGMESFRAAGEGSARLSAPGSTQLQLGQNHRLAIEAERIEPSRVRLNVKWFSGNSLLWDQPVAAPRGKGTVLAGPKAGGDDFWAVLLLVD